MLPFLACSFPAADAAASAPSGSAITLSGSLSATASSNSITSTARAVTVPSGNSGVIRFRNLTELGGSGSLLVRRNSEAYEAVVEDMEVTFANGDTITLIVTGATSAGDGASVNLFDATNGSLIATYGQPQLYRV